MHAGSEILMFPKMNSKFLEVNMLKSVLSNKISR